jgi:hypothetical protein
MLGAKGATRLTVAGAIWLPSACAMGSAILAPLGMRLKFTVSLVLKVSG